MKEIFLSLLKDARLGVRSSYRCCDYEQLFMLSQIHRVSALVYNQIYWFEDFPQELKEKWREVAIRINIVQTIKTQRFLEIYQNLLEADLKVAVVKGIICRSLYPLPDNRESSDEDLFIEGKYVPQATMVLQKSGMQITSRGKDVTIFMDPFSKLTIELHVLLLDDEQDYFYKFKQVLSSSMDSLVVHNIQGVSVYSFSYENHFLFLIFHLIKHFLHGGVGIRQLLDIFMYVEKYGRNIDWDYVWNIQKELHIDMFVLNLVSIGHAYLGFDIHKMNIDETVLKQCDYEELLEDMLNAGIFGSSTKERLHSSTITLNALKNGKPAILKSIFPTVAEMKEKYQFLYKKPYLLPFSYMLRIIKYVTNNDDKIGKKTIKMGKKRVKLLKKYKLIKKQ